MQGDYSISHLPGILGGNRKLYQSPWDNRHVMYWRREQSVQARREKRGMSKPSSVQKDQTTNMEKCFHQRVAKRMRVSEFSLLHMSIISGYREAVGWLMWVGKNLPSTLTGCRKKERHIRQEMGSWSTVGNPRAEKSERLWCPPWAAMKGRSLEPHIWPLNWGLLWNLKEKKKPKKTTKE